MGGIVNTYSMNLATIANNSAFLTGNIYNPGSFPVSNIMKKKAVEITAETQLDGILKYIPSLKPYESEARNLIKLSKDIILPIGADTWGIFFNQQCFDGHKKAVNLMNNLLRVDNVIYYFQPKEIIDSRNIILAPISFGEKRQSSWFFIKPKLDSGEHGLPEFYGMQLLLANMEISFDYGLAFPGDEYYVPNSFDFRRNLPVDGGNQSIPDIIVYRDGPTGKMRGTLWSKAPIVGVRHLTYWP